MMFSVLLVFVLIVFYLIYREIANRREAKYFRDRGVVYLKSKCYLWRIKELFSENIADVMEKVYKNYENERIIGLFDMGVPSYFLRDPALAKQIIIKDFEHFTDHVPFVDGDLDPLFGNSLVSLRGKRWRSMRVALTPAFTGSKMRQMFQLVQQCGGDMANFFVEQCTLHGPQIYEMKNLCSKFTNDVIASCAFGVKYDSFRDPDNDFYKMGQKMIKFLSPFNMFKLIIYNSFRSQALGKFLNIKIVDDSCQKMFKDIVLTNIRMREEKHIVRPDMINLMMELKKGQLKSASDTETKKSIATAEDHSQLAQTDSANIIWSDDMVVPQCFIFFFAGFDTSSTLMTFATYELAVNPDVQQKLIEEIDTMHNQLEGKELDYDHLQLMTYLDMVVAETLRKWPPVGVLDRYCNKNYIHRDESGCEIKIDEGLGVMVPVYSFHRDPKNFPDPEIFYPERFNEENKSSMNMDAYMPFGIGPRNCIGSRFALMEVKSFIYHLLLNFTFEVCEKTQVPVKLKKTMFGVIPEKVELLLKPREKAARI